MWKYHSLSDEVYKFYLEDTKRGKDATKECVERKLLAMSLVAPVVFDNGVGCKRYQFGTFNFLIRENEDKIGMVYWTKDACKVSADNSRMLRELYEIVGLNEDGQSIVKPIDETRLTEYCATYGLSNTQEYKNFKKELVQKIMNAPA